MRIHQAFAPADLARSCAFLRDLPDGVVGEIARCMSSRRVARGQCIFLKGDPGDGLFAVVSGRVKVTSLSEEGKEIILNTFGPGDVFGEIALLDGGERSANAISLADGILTFLSRQDFLRVVLSHPESTMRLLRIMADRVRRTTEQLEERAFSPMEARLARALLNARRETNGARVVTATQQQLGDMIGLSREGTNRLLRSWERSGFVEIRPGSVTIASMSALERISGAAGREPDRYTRP